jgi:NADH dehydrogenase
MASGAARWLGADKDEAGRVKVGPDLSLPGHPEIFVLGDTALALDGGGRPLPGLAPVAKQQGEYVGRVLEARLAGAPAPPPFRYRNLGTMAIIGRSRAIAHLGRLRLTGFVAWLAWSMVHLMLLVDFRSRLTVYVNWSWAWFTYGRGARLLTGRAGGARRQLHPHRAE